MAFSEPIKQEARRRAGYHCCICRDIAVSIEIHHIIPQEDGGSDDIDNAVALCRNCHGDYGANREKKKIVKEMRDWWYDRVNMIYGSADVNENFQKVYNEIEKISSNHSGTLTGLREELKRLSDKLDGSIDKYNAPAMVSEIIKTNRLANNIHANFVCSKCGTTIGLLVGRNSCPTCQEPIL